MLRFFIDRPIFSAVVSIVIVLAGLAAVRLLAVEQYPNVIPPQVVITASYPGASAEVLASSVAAPLEQEINGVDDMIYMESTATDAGTLEIVVSFEVGTDPDQATIDVNNRVQAALPQLPQRVRDLGVRVKAFSTTMLMAAALYSPDDTHDVLYISNYALLNVIDELQRLPGVGEAELMGSLDYSMRIWLQPDVLARYHLTPSDVAAALREQNVQFAAGQIGAEPAPAGQQFTYTVTAPGQFSTEEEFRDIILRADRDGNLLRLGDVARVELGSRLYAFSASYNGKPSVPIAVYMQPGANALDTAQGVRDTLAALSERFPEGMEYAIPFDTTEFVEVSIRQVTISLLVAVLLVVLVSWLFLQRFLATLIPVAAIPVSLIGTFAGMYLLGFSINLLTLFGLVLAIGIVVDNAIIVMENVERLMEEKKLSARDASVATMQEVSGAVVASTLVLVAVFMPVAFMGGLSGELYRQFAVTIAVSVVVSGVVAVTLTPALCALLLDRQKAEVAAPFRWFNRQFDRLSEGFTRLVRQLLLNPGKSLLLFVALTVIAVWLFARMPDGLVPAEDQGAAHAVGLLPVAASLPRSEQVRDDFAREILAMEEVDSFLALAGLDILAGSLRTNAFSSFVDLTDWSDRRKVEQQAEAVVQRIGALGFGMQEANVVAFSLPPIMGLSVTGGVEGYLQVRGEASVEEIVRLGERFVELAQGRPELAGTSSQLQAGIPRYRADVDREQARLLGVPINQIFEAMQSTFGTLYVNDFSLAGRNWQVNLQSEGDFRSSPDDLRRVFVRSDRGEMVSLDTVVSMERTVGSDIANRYNLYYATKVMSNPAPGYTSGQAKQALEAVVDELRMEEPDILLGWVGEAYQLDAAAGAAGLAFFAGMIMVFLILAAQYESWKLPLAVLGAIPVAVLGAGLAASLRGYPNDIYFQVGLLVLTGLAAKNAILIVEFAAQNRRQGLSAFDAALAATRQRLRAIAMTALTLIIGTLPLFFATGAGANSQREIGTVVVGGMLAASSLALLFVPLFYCLLDGLALRPKAGGQPAGRADSQTG